MEFEKMPLGDQSAINLLLQEKSIALEWGVFPAQIWAKSQGPIPPDDIMVHHANCTVNTADKVKQLQFIRRIVSAKPGSAPWIYKKSLIMKRRLKKFIPFASLPITLAGLFLLRF